MRKVESQDAKLKFSKVWFWIDFIVAKSWKAMCIKVLKMGESKFLFY